MLPFLKNYIFEKPDRRRLTWLYAYNKKATVSGLVFVFITFTALSLVDRFYFAAAYYQAQSQPNPFGWDSFFRLFLVPAANLGAIAHVRRCDKCSTRRLINASAMVLYLTLASLACTAIVHEYYSANDFTWEVVALMVFTLTMFGMPFRNSFLISLSMLGLGLAFLLFDKMEQKVIVYNTTYMVAIWGAMIVGAYRKSELRRENFRAFTMLKESALELDAKARELAQRNDELQQFAYASSHDLQEPLRTISNFVAILEKRLNGQLSDELRLYMGFIAKSTERMKHLIHAILEYSRIGRDMELSPINCDEALRQVLADLNYAIAKSKANVQLEPLPDIVGYDAEFSMLVQNLLGNAMKFHRAGVPPEIVVSAKESEHEYQFSVADNGIGIDRRHLEKVFDLFGRLHNKDEYEGTGIGLAHCKKIVDLHGGKIWVDSMPGEGSTFHFTISKRLKPISNDTTSELHHAD